jgi:diaminopimelate decarboxylase
VTSHAAATLPLADLLPVTAGLTAEGHLALGGCDALELAQRFGTPLYVYDARTLREQCRGYVEAFRAEYPESTVLYASKAYLSRPFARLIAAEGLGFDAVSGGEIEVLRAAGVAMDTVYLHGNNKEPWELALAVEAGVGRVVIDNEGEIALLAEAAAARGVGQPVLLRVSPGVDAHTHEKTTTGILDSKFGVPIATGAAERALAAILAQPALELRGLHMHLGSPIVELAPYELGIEVMADFVADVCRDRLGVAIPELSPGGGFAVGYGAGDPVPTPRDYAHALAVALRREWEARGLPLPRIAIEPGRSIVARAGVALYSVGARKEVPGIRTYLSVNGGMADNMRPAMYGARYEALSAERPTAEAEETVTVAGKYCESGDVLLRDARLPRLRTGELLAMPAAGAYQLSMASNYNLSYRPAVVLVEDGEARLLRRRESAADLMALDVDDDDEPASEGRGDA